MTIKLRFPFSKDLNEDFSFAGNLSQLQSRLENKFNSDKKLYIVPSAYCPAAPVKFIVKSGQTFYCWYDLRFAIVLPRYRFGEEKPQISVPTGITKILVKNKGDNQTFDLMVNLEETIETVKNRLLKAGILHESQELRVHIVEEKAAETATLTELQIAANSTLTISIRDKNKLQNSPEWQPAAAQQTTKGMSCFLSSLYVFSRMSDMEFNRFIKHVNSLFPFPPVWLGLNFIQQNSSDLPYIYKSAISNYFYHLFSLILTKPKKEEYFEHSREILGELVSNAEKEIDTTQLLVRNYLLDVKTYERIVTPYEYKGNFYDVTSIQSFQDDQDNLPIFRQDIQDMLLHFPTSTREVYTWNHPEMPPSADSLDILTGLKDLMSAEINFNKRLVEKKSIFCVIPTLLIMKSPSPCIIRNSENEYCVSIGPAACSVGTVYAFNPISGKQYSFSPYKLAEEMAGNIEEEVDNRTVRESIVVLIDTSNSMCTKATTFISEKQAKEEEIPLFDLSKEAIEIELETLSESQHFYWIVKRFKNANYRAQIWEELERENHTWKSIVKTNLGRNMVKELFEKHSSMQKPILDKIISSTKKVKTENTNTPTMQIFCKNLSGKTIILDVNPADTIKQIKAQIESKEDIAVKQQKLSYSGRILDDKLSLEFYNIQKESTLHLSLCNTIPLDELITVNVCYLNNNKSDVHKTYTLLGSTTIITLKYKIWNIENQNPAKFSLWKNLKPGGDGFYTGTYLQDNETIAQHAKLTDGEYMLSAIVQSPYKSQQSSAKLSRLDIVKQLFNAFVNRSLAYNYPTRVALTLFNDHIENVCKFTPSFELFRKKVENAYPNGDTSLYDAINDACSSLVEYSKKHTESKLRIICLTDGQDTKSKSIPETLVNFMLKNKIILDSILIGEADKNQTLPHMSKTTGGYAFAPKNLENALRIMELETFLFSPERIAPNANFQQLMWNSRHFSYDSTEQGS